MELELQGRTALVTGSDRGTGEVIARTLAEEGARVVWHSRKPFEDDRLQVNGDIATESGCTALVEQLSTQGLEVDILINNYGTAERGRWSTSQTEDWLDMYQKNVLSAARLAQGLMEPMRARGWGRIINLGTIGSHQPNSIMPAYYAAKGALATMTVSLCRELAGSGVTANTVAPGLIHTPELEAGYRQRARKKGWGEDWDDILSHLVETDYPNPCGRIAQRQEVADLVAFLSSPRAGFINGQNIRIDGGAVIYV